MKFRRSRPRRNPKRAMLHKRMEKGNVRVVAAERKIRATTPEEFAYEVAASPQA